MKNYQKIKKITISSVFIVLGILIPYFSSHMMGMPGTIFLPMHLPVILSGMFLGPLYGLMIGLITPLLSSLLTGMPIFFPMLPIMMVELLIYGFTSGLLFNKLKLSIYFSLPLTMIAGRIGYGLMFYFLLLINHGTLKALSVTSALVTGMPGIIIQIIIIPIVITIYQQKNKIIKENILMKKIVKSSIQKIKNSENTLIIIKNNEIVYQSNETGIKSLLKLYLENPLILENSYVIDKIIGKATAILTIKGKAKFVYGKIMSKLGKEYLEDASINYHYDILTDVIMNRTNDGLCPIENTVLNIQDNDIAINAIINKLQDLQNQKGK